MSFIISSDSCRICLKKSHHLTYPNIVDGLSMAQVFRYCTGLEMDQQKSEFFPAIICENCTCNMLEAYHFKKKSLESDQALHILRARELHVDNKKELSVPSKAAADFPKEAEQILQNPLLEELSIKVDETEQEAEQIEQDANCFFLGTDEIMAEEFPFQISEVNSEENLEIEEKYDHLKTRNHMMKKTIENLKRENQNLRGQIVDLQQQNLSLRREKKPVGRHLNFTTNPALLPKVTALSLADMNTVAGPGEKADSNFVNALITKVWGENLINRSVTGKQSNAHKNLAPKAPLSPNKLQFVYQKIFERVDMETGSQHEISTRASESRINKMITQKLNNLHKIMNRKRATISQEPSDFEEEDSIEIKREKITDSYENDETFNE